MALSRLEDFDPNYQNRLGGDIRSFEVYTHANQPVGRVVDAWVDDIGNIQQLVVDLNAPSPGNHVMLPIAEAQIDRPTKRIYVNDLSRLQPEPVTRHQDPSPSHPVPEASPGYRMASLEESAPLEAPRAYRRIEPIPPTHQPSARRVELPPIPPDAYDHSSQGRGHTAHPPIPPVDVHRETYSQNYSTSSPVPPSTAHNINPSQVPASGIYEPEQSPIRREDPRVVSEEVIPVLEERVVVDNHVRKAGEVVVRKEIETEIVEVPVKREKLIVEQVGAEPKQLAEIDLHQDDISDSEIIDRLNERRQTKKKFD